MLYTNIVVVYSQCLLVSCCVCIVYTGACLHAAVGVEVQSCGTGEGEGPGGERVLRSSGVVGECCPVECDFMGVAS